MNLQNLQEIVGGIMYILIFSTFVIVFIKLIYDKIKNGRFFEKEKDTLVNNGEKKK